MKKLAVILITLIVTMTLMATAAGCDTVPTGQPAPVPSTQHATSPSPTPIPTTGPASPAGTGTLQVLVTDAPPQEEVTSILITVSEVQVHKAVAEQEEQQNQSEDEQIQEQEQEQGDEGGWTNIQIIEAKNTFDLLEIKGVEELLGENQVEAGKYTQVRLKIDKAEVGLGGAQPEAATVPSGVLKLVHPFDVVAGKTTSILLDFDAEKSVNITGNDRVMVKPVIKLSVKQGKSSSRPQKPAENPGEENQGAAEAYVKNSPTFLFDGMQETLQMAEAEQLQENTWQYTFEFDSRHAGYGDRSGNMPAEAITHHNAVITIENGDVTSAVLDGKWDMLEQRELGAVET